MKHFFSIVFLLVAIVACSQLEAPIMLPEEAAPVSSYNITANDIDKIDFTRLISPKTKTNNTTSKEITPVVEETDTLLYVINYGDSDGWVIASADKRMPLALAIGEKDHFDMDLALNNPGFRIWLDRMKERVLSLKQDPEWVPDSSYLAFWQNPENTLNTKGGAEHENEWLQLVYTIVEQYVLHYDIAHFVPTHWRPDEPWNVCLPINSDTTRCEAGCVTVAGAQTAYYLHSAIGKPAQAYQYGSCNSYYNANPTINLYNPSSSVWATMPMSTVNANSTGIAAVGALMADVAQRSDALWCQSHALVSFAGLMDYFSDYSVSCNVGYFDNETILDDIVDYLPVIVGLNSTNPEMPASHTAVIDGIKVYSQRYTYFYQWMPMGTFPPVEPEFPDLDHPELYEIGDAWGNNTLFYYRLNWGYNLAFLDDALYMYDTPWGSGSLYYEPDIILYNFH